jgi:hypothetical protein
LSRIPSAIALMVEAPLKDKLTSRHAARPFLPFLRC